MKTWKTIEGKIIALPEMSDLHLENTIKMLERKAPATANRMALAAMNYASGAPDGAAMAAEHEAETLLDGEYEVSDIYPQYTGLIKERRRRIRVKKWSLK